MPFEVSASKIQFCYLFLDHIINKILYFFVPRKINGSKSDVKKQANIVVLNFLLCSHKDIECFVIVITSPCTRLRGY